MTDGNPPGTERRGSERRSPRYSPEEIEDLRITRVRFREDYLFCLMSDGNTLCVPLTISPVLRRTPPKLRYLWRITEDGKAVVWSKGTMGDRSVHLDLKTMLAYPESQIMG